MFATFAVLGWFCAYVVPERWRMRALSGVSLMFYAWIDVKTMLLLVVLAGVVQAVCREQRGSLLRRNAGIALTAGVLTLWRLAPELTLYFKVSIDSWWVPVASGFLALQSVIVITDTYRRDAEVPSYTETLLLLGFFPKALAGPLVRTGSFLYSLKKKPINVDLKAVSVLVFAAAVKKYLISGALENLAATVVPSSLGLSKIDLMVMFLVGPVRFVVDISAYTDLARAAGLMTGVDLPDNMRNPFGARSVGEFLRRWHVTVSGFFRDYVLAEITSPRTRDWVYCLATIFTCVLIGLWHAPGASTALWGALVGLPVGLEQVRARRVARKREPRREHRRIGVFVTIFYYGMLSPLYTNDTIAHNMRVILRVLSPDGFSAPITPWWGFVLLFVGMIWFSGAMSFTRGVTNRAIKATPTFVVVALASMSVAFFAGFAGSGIPNFIYQGL